MNCGRARSPNSAASTRWQASSPQLIGKTDEAAQLQALRA